MTRQDDRNDEMQQGRPRKDEETGSATDRQPPADTPEEKTGGPLESLGRAQRKAGEAIAGLDVDRKP